MDPERAPGSRHTREQERDGGKTDTEAVPRDHDDDCCDEQQRHCEEKDVPDVAPTPHRVPCRGKTPDQQGDHHQAARKLQDDLDHGHDDTGHEQHHSHPSSCTPTEHPVVTPSLTLGFSSRFTRHR